jgi:hypothetical protein
MYWEGNGVDVVLMAPPKLVSLAGPRRSVKVDAKIIRPPEDTGSVHQALLGIPLSMFEGETCFSTIKVSLASKFREGTLEGHCGGDSTRWVSAQLQSAVASMHGLQAGQFGNRLGRHICMPPMSPFLCFWDGSDALKSAAPHRMSETERQGSWAAEVQQLVQAAKLELKAARADLQRIVNANKQRGQTDRARHNRAIGQQKMQQKSKSKGTSDSSKARMR